MEFSFFAFSTVFLAGSDSPVNSPPSGSWALRGCVCFYLWRLRALFATGDSGGYIASRSLVLSVKKVVDIPDFPSWATNMGRWGYGVYSDGFHLYGGFLDGLTVFVLSRSKGLLLCSGVPSSGLSRVGSKLFLSVVR